MDPVILALINSLKGQVNNQFNDFSTQINSVLTGIEDYDVDGLDLVIKLKDGTERTMSFPQPADVDDVFLSPDENDKVHLFITLENGSAFDCGEIPAGLSAYDIAVQNGYEGTEAEWLATLPGRREPVRFDFDTPSTEWKVQHNTNDRYARFTVYDDEGDEVANPVINRVSLNLAIVNFDIPLSGFVIVS